MADGGNKSWPLFVPIWAHMVSWLDGEDPSGARCLFKTDVGSSLIIDVCGINRNAIPLHRNNEPVSIGPPLYLCHARTRRERRVPEQRCLEEERRRWRWWWWWSQTGSAVEERIIHPSKREPEALQTRTRLSRTVCDDVARRDPRVGVDHVAPRECRRP